MTREPASRSGRNRRASVDDQGRWLIRGADVARQASERLLAGLLKRRDDVHFLTVGSGPMVKPVEWLLRKSGLEENFTRVATLGEIADIYSIIDVSVLCSKVEGFPNAVMEAMATRTPVIAANVGGIPEIVRDGETGRLIDGRDPEPYAEAIEGLLEDDGEARRMGEAAQAYVRDHLSLERMADAYRKLYAEMLIRTARSGA